MKTIKKDEIFVGNGNEIQIELLKRKGIDCRLGEQGYTIDGKKEKGIKPVFVKKKDFNKYNNFMMKK